MMFLVTTNRDAFEYHAVRQLLSISDARELPTIKIEFSITERFFHFKGHWSDRTSFFPMPS